MLLNLCGQGEGTGAEVGSESLQHSAGQEDTEHDGLELNADDDERKSRNSRSSNDGADRSYEHPDPVEVAAARLRAQQPSIYERLGVNDLDEGHSRAVE